MGGKCKDSRLNPIKRVAIGFDEKADMDYNILILRMISDSGIVLVDFCVSIFRALDTRGIS